MNEEVLNKLDLILQKLGAGFNTVWPSLVHRVLIIGYFQVLAGLLLSLTALVISYKVWKTIERKKLGPDGKYPDFDEYGLFIVISAMALIFGIILLSLGAINIESPEAGAVLHLMRIIR